MFVNYMPLMILTFSHAQWIFLKQYGYLLLNFNFSAIVIKVTVTLQIIQMPHYGINHPFFGEIYDPLYEMALIQDIVKGAKNPENRQVMGLWKNTTTLS